MTENKEDLQVYAVHYILTGKKIPNGMVRSSLLIKNKNEKTGRQYARKLLSKWSAETGMLEGGGFRIKYLDNITETIRCIEKTERENGMTTTIPYEMIWKDKWNGSNRKKKENA